MFSVMSVCDIAHEVMDCFWWSSFEQQTVAEDWGDYIIFIVALNHNLDLEICCILNIMQFFYLLEFLVEEE